MVFVEVISVNGGRPDTMLAATIPSTGGTIGRGQSNALGLPDPGRTVSRTHAQFLSRQGVVKVLCRGPNGLVVDGQPVEMGDEVPISDGSQLQMGAYVLRARLSGQGPTNRAT